MKAPMRSAAIEELAAEEPNALCIGPFGSDLLTSDFVEVGIPVVFVRNVRPGRFDPADMRYVTPAKAEQLRSHRVRRGDIVITKMGLPPCVAAAYPDDALDGVITADIIKLTPDTRRVEPRYVVHFLNSSAAKAQVEKFTFGVTRPKVTLKHFRGMRIPLPDLAEQRRIVDILDKADAIRRKRKQAIALTEELLRSTFLDMFGDPVTNPKGWPTVPIEALASAERNALAIGPFGSNLLSSDYTTSGHPVIFVRDLVKGQFVWKSNVFVSLAKFTELAAHHAQPGDVLATKMGDPPGIACVVPDYFPRAVVTADVVKVSVDRAKVFPAYMAAAINSAWGRRQISGITAGVTRAKITLRDFRNVLVRLPPLEQQRRYVDHVAKVARMKEELAVGSAEAKSLFVALVSQAFSGSLEAQC